MAIGRLNIGLTGVQPGGLAKVIPSSVAVGSGTGTVDSNGTVTFSGASSVSINNCFTSNYKHYRIIIDELDSASSDQNLLLRLRADTTDLSSSVYEFQRLTAGSTSIAGERFFSQSSIRIGVAVVSGSSYKSSVILDLTRPQDTKFKTLLSNNFYPQNATGPVINNFYGNVASAVSHNGFTIFAGTNISGTISVYGYN